jgi:FkbM family methyltransferase
MNINFSKTRIAGSAPLYFPYDADRNDVYSRAIAVGNLSFDEACLYIRRYFQTEALPNRSFVDVGANIGTYTLAIATLGVPTIAIEALAENFLLLSAGIERNRLRNVRCIFAAITDEIDIRHISGDSAWGSLTEQGNLVAGLTLDHVIAVNDVPPPALIKIDIEGHEHAALRGIEKSLEMHPDMDFLIEVIAGNQINLQFLEERGYYCYMIKLGSLIPASHVDFQECLVTDYFCTRKDIASPNFAATPILHRDDEVIAQLIALEVNSIATHRISIGARLQFAPEEIKNAPYVLDFLEVLKKDSDADVRNAVLSWMA